MYACGGIKVERRSLSQLLCIDDVADITKESGIYGKLCSLDLGYITEHTVFTFQDSSHKPRGTRRYIPNQTLGHCITDTCCRPLRLKVESGQAYRYGYCTPILLSPLPPFPLLPLFSPPLLSFSPRRMAMNHIT